VVLGGARAQLIILAAGHPCWSAFMWPARADGEPPFAAVAAVRAAWPEQIKVIAEVPDGPPRPLCLAPRHPRR